MKSPGYDEIIVKYSISATSKGFSVHHYPIVFFETMGLPAILELKIIRITFIKMDIVPFTYKLASLKLSR